MKRYEQMKRHDFSIKKIAERKPQRDRKSKQDGSMLSKAMTTKRSLKSATFVLFELKE